MCLTMKGSDAFKLNQYTLFILIGKVIEANMIISQDHGYSYLLFSLTSELLYCYKSVYFQSII